MSTGKLWDVISIVTLTFFPMVARNSDILLKGIWLGR